jgi:small subunit ribosomal protein S29
MATPSCWRCLARPSPSLTSLHATTYQQTQSIVPALSFSTSAVTLAGRQTPSTPKRGEKATFVHKGKKGKGREKTGKPPAPGERKAMRKRIVLSNTNALEVFGMVDLNAKNITDPSLVGNVMGISGTVVDKLRAAEAFKPTQSWGLFRRPGTLMRAETIELAKLLESSQANKKVLKEVLIGDRGSGKSLYLLQAMTMGFLKDWVVINIPEGTTYPSAKL